MLDYSKIITQLESMDSDRKRRYKEYLDFYNGHQWPNNQRTSRRITVNYAQALIDKVTSYLMGGMVVNIAPFQNTQEEKNRAFEAENYLHHQVFAPNNIESLDYTTEVDAAILGDSAYKITWDITEQRIKITAPDVGGIYLWSVDGSHSKYHLLVSQYEIPNETARTYGITSNRPRLTAIEFWTEQNFQLWINKEKAIDIPNPYNLIPFIIFPNLVNPKELWGRSDIPQLIETQVELNREATQLSKILELSGNPITVLENISESNDITITPGKIWELPEGAKAYLLDLLHGGGMSLHLDYINMLFNILHDLSETPKAAWGTTDRDLSGVALEIEMQPLLQKVARKRAIREHVYTKRNDITFSILRTMTGIDFTNLESRISWQPVLPRDTTRMVNEESLLVEKLIHPRRISMERLGITDTEAVFKEALDERERILSQNRPTTSTKPTTERESENKQVEKL